jgi:hypothetical protein
MPVDLLYYNPETHRIRAQRTLDPVRDAILQSEPFSDPAQTYLHQLLMGDPTDPNKTDAEFTALKTDISLHGMRDPGIITRSGILVNGNTRCAALRELDIEHMAVGVLPADAAWRDIELVELSLQLRRDYRRDYSYVNLLLAIDEQLDLGRGKEEVCKDFRITAKTLRKHMWILELIHQAIERSTSHVGDTTHKLRLVDFENHQGKLEELYRSYNALSQSDAEKAEMLKEARLSGLVLGGSKTDLRLVEPDFVEGYLERNLPKDFLPAAGPRKGKTIPGLDISAQGTSGQLATAQLLTDKLLKARATVEGAGSDPAPRDDSQAASTKELATARDAFSKALEHAGKTALLKKRRFGPPERLSDAADDVALCYQAVVEARATDAFDLSEFDESLLNFRTQVEALAKLVGREVEDDTLCEGVSWLLGTLNGSGIAQSDA